MKTSSERNGRGLFRAWRRLRAMLRPPRSLRITRSGRTFLVVTVGVGLGALNTGNNLLYLLLGLLLSAIVVSGVLSERCLRGLQVQRLGPDAAHAGEPFPLRYSIRRRRGPAFALELSEADVSGLQGQARLSYLGPGEERVLRATMQADRRGPLQLQGVRVTTTFPLGLFAKSRVLELPGVLLVYPRRGFACANAPETDAGPLGDAGNPRRRDGGGDLLGLRELQEGEDARRVHWMKSAAAGRLLRTEREREERRQFVLSLASEGPLEELDRRCEETAALAHRLLSDGHEVGLEVGLEAGATRLRPAAGPGHERRILDALARVGFE